MSEFSEGYRRATVAAGGACPIESGFIGGNAELECRHGRLPTDPTPACGCWPSETAAAAADAFVTRGGRTERLAGPPSWSELRARTRELEAELALLRAELRWRRAAMVPRGGTTDDHMRRIGLA